MINRIQVASAAVLVFCAACGDRTPPPPAAAASPARIQLAVPGRSNAAPSVAAFGKTVAVVWTASGDAGSDIYLSVSSDGGSTFGAPVRVNDVDGDARASGEQAARVAVGKAVMHVAWPSRHGDHSVIRYASSTDGGKSFSPATSIAGDNLSGARGWESMTLGYDGSVQ